MPAHRWLGALRDGERCDESFDEAVTQPAYLGDADPQVAVPARRDDLSGLPPAWIGVGTNDLFHDEDLAYAEHLTAVGVPCELEVVPGASHGFDLWASKSPVSQRFFDSQCEVLRAGLAPVG